MPAPPPAFYPENVLENANATMTPDGPLAGQSTVRLGDRDIGLECEDSGTASTRTWKWDRGIGATSPTVHVLILAGRNLSGVAFTYATSTDDTTYTTRATFTPTSDAPLLVVFGTPFTMPRYARLTCAAPANPVVFTEVFCSPRVALKWKPAAARLRQPTVPNVVFVTSFSGRTHGVKRGQRRQSYVYEMFASPDTDYTQVLAILDTIDDGANPFWLETVRSTASVPDIVWVRLDGAIDLQGVDLMATEWTIPLTMTQELP